MWSFGVVIYEILARNNPYEGKDPVQAVKTFEILKKSFKNLFQFF